MNLSKTIFLSAGLILATEICAAGQIAKKSFYQESRTTISKDNQSQIINRKVWVKYPGKARLEESFGPQTRLTVSNGTDFWVAVPSLKKGQHRRLTPAEAQKFASQLQTNLDVVPKFVKMGARKVRHEKVNGVECDVYELTKKGQLTQTLWVASSGPRLAQRQQESGVVRAADSVGQPMKTHVLKSVTEFLKWQLDVPVDDSKFTPPAGVTYQEAAAAPNPAPAPKKR